MIKYTGNYFVPIFFLNKKNPQSHFIFWVCLVSVLNKCLKSESSLESNKICYIYANYGFCLPRYEFFCDCTYCFTNLTMFWTSIECTTHLSHRYQFAEVRYLRQEEMHKGKLVPARVETTVIFLPDVWSCNPTRLEWATLQAAYKKQLQKKVAAVSKEGGKEANSQAQQSISLNPAFSS